MLPGAIELGLAFVNGATLAANYIRAGYEMVVFEYSFEERTHIQRFLDGYDAVAPVRCSRSGRRLTRSLSEKGDG